MTGGEVGDRILYQDERIRIWEMVLEPGQRSPVHHHAHDYVVVVVEGDHLTVEPAEGSEVRAGEGYGAQTIEPGESVLLRSGAIEVAVNTGTVRYRDVQIEFLGPSTLRGEPC